MFESRGNNNNHETPETGNIGLARFEKQHLSAKARFGFFFKSEWCFSRIEKNNILRNQGFEEGG